MGKPEVSDLAVWKPSRAGVKPAPTTGRPIPRVGAGFIPARMERVVLKYPLL
jgi:hypothetical protein